MDGWWSEVDEAALSALAAAGGTLTLTELASVLAMSEDGVRSVMAMLAERGRVRITAVELARPHGVGRAAARTSPRGGRAPGSGALARKAGRAAP